MFMKICYPKQRKKKYDKVSIINKLDLIDYYPFGYGDIGDTTAYQDGISIQDSLENLNNIDDVDEEIDINKSIEVNTLKSHDADHKFEISSYNDEILLKNNFKSDSIDKMSDNNNIDINNSHSTLDICLNQQKLTKLSAHNINKSLISNKPLSYPIDLRKSTSTASNCSLRNKYKTELHKAFENSNTQLLSFSMHPSISKIKTESIGIIKENSLITNSKSISNNKSSKHSNLTITLFKELENQRFRKINKKRKLRNYLTSLSAFIEIKLQEKLPNKLTNQELERFFNGLITDVEMIGLKDSTYRDRPIWLYNFHVEDSLRATKDFMDYAMKIGKGDVINFPQDDLFLSESDICWRKAKILRNRKLDVYLIDNYRIILRISRRFMNFKHICARCYTLMGLNCRNLLQAAQWMLEQFRGFRGYSHTSAKSQNPPQFRF